MYPQITQLQTARRVTTDELERERQVAEARQARASKRRRQRTIASRVLASVRPARA